MPKLLATIEGCDITLFDDGTVKYTAKFAVDTDGSGPLHGDPDAQADTSLHLNGKALNADVDKYIVVPPAIIHGVGPVVLGCQAFARNTRNGMKSEAVVGDIGPHKKLGEGSVALAKALGINPSPTRGGEDAHIVEITILPGQAAAVDAKQYTLQPSHAS